MHLRELTHLNQRPLAEALEAAVLPATTRAQCVRGESATVLDRLVSQLVSGLVRR